ncbi:phosphoribosylamine--glycine ligase [Coprothermobacter platensis]|uniref:phosphoribosylamine--glycine ligase n=1 Tax=Coprothermobacter platensis TaxID=108819 RepID=UPI0003798E6B|nr:phosphoribosylamine--glycine ligase [Coprothermobacter platensis]
MNILVIGSGGREHALIYKLRQSPQVRKIYCAPGNGGIASMAETVDIGPLEVDKLRAFALSAGIDLTVVGPEIPLMAGIADVFEDAGLTVFGPKKSAAVLEGSKVFAKDLMKRCNVSTANFEVFSHLGDALSYVRKQHRPLVVKADGLAQGKGVSVCHSEEEAETALRNLMEEKAFAGAGEKVVVEELLEGKEASVFALCNGENGVIFGSAMDYKRAHDNDEGPNTGGMGSVSPHPMLDKNMEQTVLNTVVLPILHGLLEQGIAYKGVLYVGLMLTKDGPKVLEFNVRFGDPETQAMMPLLKSDLPELMMATCIGDMGHINVDWASEKSVCIVAASQGYPGHYETGFPITGLNDVKDGFVFHAGTAIGKNGSVITSGGRVLNVVATGKNYEEARQKAYMEVQKISFPGMFYRSDIAANLDT